MRGTRPFVELSAGSSWANKMGLTVGTTPNPTTNGISLTHKTGYDVAVSAGMGFGLLLAFTRKNPYLTRSPYVVKWSNR